MLDKHTTPWRPLALDDIRSLIQFFDPAKNLRMNDLQTDGCHRLWNTLCDDSLRFAYLADEVGMGKTYQALGVVGLLHYLKPDARILILCPGQEMQKQWSSDWHSFFKDKFCPNGIDGELKSLRIEANGIEGFESSVQPLLCENLNQFGASLIASQHSAYLLRYSSFSLPIRVFDWDSFREDRGAHIGIKNLEENFRQCMAALALPVSNERLESASPNRKEELSLADASRRFLDVYAKCMADLINVFSPDLVIWDEAQYLRTDATRNDSMRKMFGALHQAGSRHLFLSATPAHRDVSDIEQLDHLMLDENGQKKGLIRISRDGHTDSFKRSVSRWMVRRERCSPAGMGKLQYRSFQEQPVDLFAQNQSPLYALTFAVMQKNLVKLLDGQNNRFRMGEISCHESSRASIEGAGRSKPGAKAERHDDEPVLEESVKRSQAEPIDEHYLRGLGERFKSLQLLSDRDTARDLPHAKVDHVVRELSRTCFENGTLNKELVFVRRVATVDELADGLLREFQHILDRRIEAFGEQPEIYWGLAVESEDSKTSENKEEIGDEPEDSGEFFGAASELPYFKALSAVKGNLGRLNQYRSSLFNVDTSTIRFLLLASEDMGEAHKLDWRRFLSALGVSEEDERYKSFKEDSNREFLLRRCIAHSIRFTDILVDLDILRHKYKRDYVHKWLDMLKNPTEELSTYFVNTRAKLLCWLEHFDTIVNKCFKVSGQHSSYVEIANNVHKYFRGLSPVARRSGRRKNENAVIQFKFPIFPNILICTDVLREGVNLHLFCDRISHYGLAWNSGDMEQRIGRVERADSLFERRILKDKSYKLHVGFPFLAGTLDERQVKKAIRRKREIDSLFSIVPPKETGEYDDSKELEGTETYVYQASEQLLPEIKVSPVPNDQWSNLNLENKKKWSQALQQAHKLLMVDMRDFDWQGFRYSCCRMLGQLGLIVVEWEKLSGSKKCAAWNACDKQILGVFGKERKTQWKSVRTLYFPVDQALTENIVEIFWVNAKAELSASQIDDDHHDFEYCSISGAHAKQYEVSHPTDKKDVRKPISYRCRWGRSYAVVSVVCELNDAVFTRTFLEELASNINKSLPYGVASILNDRLVLTFPQVAEVDWEGNINDSIAESLAHWADRHQWILTQGEDDECFYEFPVAGISEMNTSEALVVIKSVKSWCEELCKDIDAEYEASLDWKYSSFNQVIKNGVISCATEIQSIPKVGKFQIAFSLVGLDGKPDEKQIIFYLSAKRANERVVQGDMADSWSFLSSDREYEHWLGESCSVLVNKERTHYAVSEHRDGKQTRRLRLRFSAKELERCEKRDEWLPYIVKLASMRLLNDIFQYNTVEENITTSNFYLS